MERPATVCTRRARVNLTINGTTAQLTHAAALADPDAREAWVFMTSWYSVLVAGDDVPARQQQIAVNGGPLMAR